MSLPEPVPGLVVRYSFLWSHEAKSGAAEGRKDRPAAIVVAVRGVAGDPPRVILAPITHRKPDGDQPAIEIPPKVVRSLGLDAARHWIRLDEMNRFYWPGPDLRPIPGSKPARYAYGMLPKELFEQLRQGILAQDLERRIQPVDRDD